MSIQLYPNIAKVKRNGVYQNLPGFVQASGDADIKAMIANSESSTTAQYDHPEGSYFILNDILYKALIDIAINDTIAVGTNCEVAILSDDVSEIENDVSNLKTDLDDVNVALFNSGSNMWNLQFSNANISNGAYVPLTSGITNAATEGYLSVEPSTSYCMSFVPTEKYVTIYVYEYDESKTYISELTSFQAYSTAARNSAIITTRASGHYLRFKAYRNNEPWNNVVPSNIQFEEGTSPTEYHPYGYKTSKLIPIDEELISLQSQINNNPALTQRKLVGSEVNLLETLIAGYLKNDGTFDTTTSGWYRSDYIPVIPGTFIWFYNINPWSYFGFFNSAKEWIGGRDIETPVGTNSNMLMTHQIPNGASYMIVSLEDTRASTCWGNYTPTIPTGKLIYANKETLRSYGDFPENPCDYIGMDACVFRKGLCIGDSITGGGFNYSSGTNPWSDGNVYSYPNQFAKMTGVTMVNEGHSGKSTVQWWNTYGTGGDSEIDFSGYDFAIIHLGINDVSQGTSIADTTTAYTNIINALKTANEGIKIFACTIIPAYAIPITSSYDAVNNMIKTLASTMENVYLCDLTEYGHEYINSQYSAGHLTAYGYWRLAKDLIGYIGYIMQKNPEDFRFIQFIGTDMEYTAGA